MFLHDIIKIKYIEQGYLPDYPYWMTTDKEMIDAFLASDGYFADNYPCVDETLQSEYDALLNDIRSRLEAYIRDGVEIPGWVYSYMIGSSISVNSDSEDILYLRTAFNLPVNKTDFSAEVSHNCYNESEEWIRKLPAEQRDRPASMFGEPHVIKSLRLKEVDIVGG